MDRRKFIKAGLFTSSALALGNYTNIYPYLASSLSSDYDLVAIKGGEPEAMFDKAIASFGGMKNFVKKNQKVVIKPNIGWDVKPELAANTNPKLVARIIKHCFDAGAKDVYVFDHTCDNWNRCYSNSGIEKAVKDAGAKIVSGESESYYHQVDVEKGKRLTSSKVHELILDSDVFINVPILKHHGGGKITVGMKNLMGVVWDRRYWHQNDLHQCIADFATFKKPDLNIVDAYVVMKRNGPRGVSEDDLVTLKSQIISTDIVAADAAAAKLYGIDLADVPYINYADELKVGRKDLSKLNINRIIL